MQAEFWVGTGGAEDSQGPGLPTGLKGGELGSQGLSAPHPLALHFLLLGGIFKVAHAYCPVSQGPAGGCLKDTHEDMGGGGWGTGLVPGSGCFAAAAPVAASWPGRPAAG